jgi:hypothetical protein
MTDGNTVQENESVQNTSTSSSRAPSGPAAATPTSKGGALRRFFWMDERIAQAKKHCFSKGDPGYAEFALARHAREGIVQIGETGDGNMAVLLLERVETLFLVRSFLGKNSLQVSDNNYLTDDDFAEARKIARVSETWNELSTAQQTAILSALGPKGEIGLLDLDPKTRRYLASGLRKLSSSLSESLEFEANRVGRALFARWSRVAGLGVAVIGVLFAAYGAYAKATAKPNLALHRPVTVSSQQPGEGMDHALLVDGDRTNLGFHTTHGPNQWCVIDLGSVKPISKVVVSNRADCCQDRGVPIRLEVSDDGQNYRTIAGRKEQFDSWSAEKLKTQGRYVRLSLESVNFFHLSEVEVY